MENITLYEDVDDMIYNLVVAQKLILGDQLIGCYLTRSLTYGDSNLSRGNPGKK